MSRSRPAAADLRLTVVIPTLDEAERLPRLLSDLSGLRVAHEVVVADGGSGDGTRAVAAAAGAWVLEVRRGRAPQIRAGVAAGRAPWVLLLHADCRLPPPAARALETWLEDARPHQSAYFAFALDGPGAFWRLLELGQRLRERVWGLVYGDQGLVLSRETWDAVGGVPDVPLMEDVALVDRVRRRGRLHRLPAALPTSPRRYENEGRLYGWLRNAVLVSLHRLGASPAMLARFYPSRADRSTGAGSHATAGRSSVVVFAKAPRPGRVKTRLARDAGDAAAVRLYRTMGRTVVDRLRNGPWELVVAFDPPDALDDVRAWLGEGPRYAAQHGADLGARMRGALAGALERSDRACVVGTDVPGLDAARVEEALSALDRHDLVVGPAEDGGYYLLGLDRACLARAGDALFQGVPWSTGRVLSLSLERAAALDLEVHLLPPLRDVDTIEDVPPDLRASLSAADGR